MSLLPSQLVVPSVVALLAVLSTNALMSRGGVSRATVRDSSTDFDEAPLRAGEKRRRVTSTTLRKGATSAAAARAVETRTRFSDCGTSAAEEIVSVTQKTEPFVGDPLPQDADITDVDPEGTIAVAMDGEPLAIDGQLDPVSPWGRKIARLVLSSLARRQHPLQPLRPLLAERWELSVDGRTLTFFLRSDVTWHDGKPFTAADVVFTFTRLLSHDSRAHTLRQYLRDLVAVNQSNAYTVQFEFKELDCFAHTAVAETLIFPAHVYRKGDFNTHPANRAPIGTGRLRFKRWIAGDRIELQRNDAYLGPPAGAKHVVFHVLPDEKERIKALHTGKVDLIERLSPGAWLAHTNTQRSQGPFLRLRHVPSERQWIGWNLRRPIFQDHRVRKALSLCIDRPGIVDELRHGIDRVGGSLLDGVPEGDDPAQMVSSGKSGTFSPVSNGDGSVAHRSSGAQPDSGSGLARAVRSSLRAFCDFCRSPKKALVRHEPQTCMRLLEDAGWRDTNSDGVRERDGKPLAFSILFLEDVALNEALVKRIGADMSTVGVRVSPMSAPWSEYRRRLDRRAFDAVLLLLEDHAGSDPFPLWHSSASASGLNLAGYANSEVDLLLERMRRTCDPVAQWALRDRVAEIVKRDQPYTALFERYHLSLVSRGLSGVRSCPYDVFCYADLARRIVSRVTRDP